VLVETLQPRLKGARKLLEEKRARILEKLPDGAADVEGAGTDMKHHVRFRPDGDRGAAETSTAGSIYQAAASRRLQRQQVEWIVKLTQPT
jgi:hypothetical protein